MVIHASFHISNVNTIVLKRAELDRTANISGIVMGDDGEPSGELQGSPRASAYSACSAAIRCPAT